MKKKSIGLNLPFDELEFMKMNIEYISKELGISNADFMSQNRAIDELNKKFCIVSISYEYFVN